MSSATVVVLSAGTSPFLHRVLRAALANRPGPAAVRLIWSGHDPIPSDLPPGVETVTVEPSAFDHGATRQFALEQCVTELLVFLSDDAEPIGDAWLSRLTAPFSDAAVAAAYGRQVPRPETGIAERVFRTSRYPARSRLITSEAVGREGESALPISNANSAYRVGALRSLGGFPRPCSYGEDLAVAMAALREAWRIHYVADAEVWHSHHLTVAGLFRRARSAGSLAREAREGGIRTGLRRSASGGRQLVRNMIRAGWRDYRLRGVIAAAWVSAVRALGYLSGRMGWRSNPSPR
ncbi:MAG TPA: glycosyltransferase [Gemmatimonadales bacterium]|nr:glycosyltransferase [Gemmatimonadales bacterium]